MKLYAMLGLVCLTTTSLYAAESPNAAKQTTHTLAVKSKLNASVTSATLGKHNEGVTTAALMERQLNAMKQRFDDEAELYREAGVSEEKIKKLKSLYQGIFESYQKGSQPDYNQVRKERQQLITPQDMQKVRELMIKRNEERFKKSQAETTATLKTTSAPVEKK